MRPEWLWQGLFTEILGQALWLIGAAAAGAVVVGILRARGSRWAGPILYGALSFAAFMVILFTVIGLTTLYKQPEQTTIDNIETHIKTWIDTFGLTAKKEFGEESYFSYTVTISNGIQVSVKRTKSHDRYIVFQTQLAVTQEGQDKLEKLSQEERKWVEREIVLEISRLSIEWDVSTSSLRTIDLYKGSRPSSVLIHEPTSQ